ncbi:MAG: lysophospholipid acyltransferase family protein [Myxococcota bacterium]
MKQKILSIWVWGAAVTVIVSWTGVVGGVRLLTFPIDPRRRLTSRVFHWGSHLVAWAHPYWHHRITGKLPHDVNQGYVVVCNHESHADSVLINHLPLDARWLAKKEIMDIPFLGWMMRMAGDISVKRGDQDSGRHAMEQMAEYLRQGVSVFLFPEGTRSTTGELGAFKSGAFKLAIETQRPILPMVLTGCGEALPKGGWVLGGAESHARLHIMEPIPTQGLTLDDVEKLRDEVREKMIAARRALMAEQPEPAGAVTQAA